jgi:hypothetical protein
MSLLPTPVSVLPMRSKITHVDEPVHYEAYLGGSEVSYKETPASSFSASQCSFQCNPPSPQIFISRDVQLKAKLRITLNCTAVPGAFPFQSGKSALRALPLSQIMSNLQLTINNTTLTSEVSEICNEFSLNDEDEKAQADLSLAPSFPDQSQDYESLVNSNRNCLAQYGEKTHSPFRGGFPVDSITQTLGGSSAVLEYTITEPLPISPMLKAGQSGKGLYGVQSMSVTIQWLTNLARVWSAASSSNINSVDVEFVNAPSLLFKYVTPSSMQEMNNIRSLDYNYHKTEVYKSQARSIAPNAEETLLSPSIQLNTIPKYIAVYAKQQQSDRTAFTTDSWCAVQSMRVNWANSPANLVGANQEELYRITQGNGVDMSWPDFCGKELPFISGSSSSPVRGRGSVMFLKFGKDFASSDGSVSVGTPGVYNLQIEYRAKNVSASSQNVVLYCVPLYDGVMTISGNQAMTQLAILSQSNVLDSQEEANEEGSLDAASAEGHGFWQDVGKFAKASVPYIRTARKVGQAVSGSIPDPRSQAVKGILDVAEQAGLGMTGGQKYRAHDPKEGMRQYHLYPERTGRPKKAAAAEGKALSGGAKMSKAELRRALAM